MRIGSSGRPSWRHTHGVAEVGGDGILKGAAVPAGDDERDELLRYLTIGRDHVVGILEGLSEDQLRRPVLPSGWSCLGLIKHLALADEHYWFRCVVAGESFDDLPQGPDAEWRIDPDESADDVLDLYRAEIGRANRVITTTPVDSAPAQPDPGWGEWGKRFTTLRSVMLHVIVETSVHAGHLDAVRELVDGRQWIVL